MTRSVINLRSVDLGFQSGSVVTGRIAPGAAILDAAAQRALDALLTRLRALPGVDGGEHRDDAPVCLLRTGDDGL